MPTQTKPKYATPPWTVETLGDGGESERALIVAGNGRQFAQLLLYNDEQKTNATMFACLPIADIILDYLNKAAYAACGEGNPLEDHHVAPVPLDVGFLLMLSREWIAAKEGRGKPDVIYNDVLEDIKKHAIQS